MKAFTNTPITKERFLKELKWHQEEDRFIKGTYYSESEEGFKGCAVGCSINSISIALKEELNYENHSLYEKYLGVPEWLARLQDTLFENLPEVRSKEWPIEFVTVINVGADLDKIKTPFIIYLMNENLKTLDSLTVDKNENSEVYYSIEQSKKAVKQMINAHQCNDPDKLPAAESAAWSAAWSAARSAARSAAWSAAESAAESAARSARSAAWSAAWSAARSARSAAWSAAWSAARSAAFEKHADKLLELMRECK